METLWVDPAAPCGESMACAAAIIRQGGLVAFPTETVYGLGANAVDAAAVARVYQAKGRPSDNPLIWHGLDTAAFAKVVDFPPLAQKLAAAFWPGALTLVLNRKPGFGETEAQTLAVRAPSHPVFRALLAQSGCFIAAPSANLSGRPSPTLAAHVAEDLNGRIDLLLDGGPAHNGVESTVVDVHTGVARLLRPGAISLEALREIIPVEWCGDTKDKETVKGPEGLLFGGRPAAPLSPGMKYRHYAPRAPLVLVPSPQEVVARALASPVSTGGKIGVLATAVSQKMYETAFVGAPHIVVINAGECLEDVARNLFAVLRRFDTLGVCAIYTETFPKTGVGLAIMNRLEKAAEGATL